MPNYTQARVDVNCNILKKIKYSIPTYNKR